MLSIFDISDWAALFDYKKNDIVEYNGLYYYSLVSHTSTNSFNSAYWGGITTENGFSKPVFFWKPSYDSATVVEPRVNSIKFGDGYEQRVPDGISNSLLRCELVFDQRTDAEARAITHFLYQRAGKNYFLFTPPSPYNKQKRFVCRNWPCKTVFRDNNSIVTTFEEVVN